MKALFLAKAGVAPEVVDQPSPQLRPGGVIVAMKAVPLMSYLKQVFSGELGYMLPIPFIPGNAGIGVVEQVADDVFGLCPGQMVYIDPQVGSHTNTGNYDSILQGLTGMSPLSPRIQEIWRNGTLAEKALVPAECLTPLDPVTHLGSERLCSLSRLAVPLGGLMKGGFEAGQTVIIGGATGNFGAGGVLVALALGATKVVPVGHNRRVLDLLRKIDPRRVEPAIIVDEQSPVDVIRTAVGEADFYLDMFGRTTPAAPMLAAISCLRRGGKAVLMGGVQTSLPLPYSQIMLNEITIQGAFMYPRTTPGLLVRLLASGQLNLDAVNVTPFPLKKIEEALNQAEKAKGLDYTVVTP